MADDLLEYYTAEQLRAHFLGLGLGLRSVSFAPKPLNPQAGEKDADPVLKEGNLLTNVLNRIARSCFYTSQKYFDGRHPPAQPSQNALDAAAEAALDYERLISRCELHQVMNLLDAYIRNINKDWVKNMKEADDKEKEADATALRGRVLSDSLHLLRVAAVLVHPIAPDGAEMIADYLMPGCSHTDFFSWDNIFKTIADLSYNPENHKFKFLEQRVDFFVKHQSQLM
jgi:methionyl-tRNA synthetase